MDDARTARARHGFVRTLGHALALSILLAAVLVAPRAFAQAQTPPSPAELAAAKKFFAGGLLLKNEGLYREALASFLEADTLAPRESIQNNIALTYRLMKDMASAYSAYELLLSRYGGTMNPKLKGEAERAVEALEVLTGAVTIGVQEPGAKVVVDDRDVGVTPVAHPVRVNIGTHRISITKEGFEPLVQPFEIHGHDTVPVAGPLVKSALTGHVVIDVKQTTPPDTTVLVYVDASEAGAPPYAGDLEPGTHTIEARGTTAAASPRQIKVEKGGRYEETLPLHAQAGTVAVNVDVADSEIALDGAVVAHGVYEGQAAAGPHALTVSKPGYPTYKKDILVRDGERVLVEVPLQKGAGAPPDAAKRDFKGLYSHLEFVGQFEVTRPTNDVAQSVGYNPGTPVSGSSIYGFGMDIRAGYSFGFIGVEGTVLLGYDHSSVSATLAQGDATASHPGPTPRTEEYDFSRVGGTAALGVRLMPKTQVFRPTLGVAGGVSLKGVFYNRTIQSQAAALTGTYTQTTNPAFYAAPSIMVDAGIELGSTPGTKFYLGCLLVADFAGAVPVSTTSTDPNFGAPPGGLNGVNGTDVFIGPILGFQFGD